MLNEKRETLSIWENVCFLFGKMYVILLQFLQDEKGVSGTEEHI